MLKQRHLLERVSSGVRREIGQYCIDLEYLLRCVVAACSFLAHVSKN